MPLGSRLENVCHARFHSEKEVSPIRAFFRASLLGMPLLAFLQIMPCSGLGHSTITRVRRPTVNAM